MPARELFVGLDAAEATLLERDAGCATLSALAAARAPVPLATSMETLPGALWSEILTGRAAGKPGVAHHPRQLRDGAIDARAFFTAAGEAGRRVAAIDLPMSVQARGLPGVMITGWALHDQLRPPAAEPPELLEELSARHGEPVACNCHAHGGTPAGEDRLLAHLLDRARRKTELLVDLLGRERWDLFACAFTEPHCAGHRLWHRPDALAAVYRAVDEGAGRLLAAA